MTSLVKINRACRRVFFLFFGHPFKGMVRDIKANLPFYWSDWSDGLNYRVVPSTIYMYFTNLLPAIAFAQDLFDKTQNSYGVNEVLLASAMGGIVFGVLSGQPLCIVGVTGPIAIFNYTVYQIAPDNTPYFPFMCWIYLWAMVMHFIIAIFNWVNGLRCVTKFSCDIFGFFINIIYIEKGVQLLVREFDHGTEIQGYLSVVVALLTMVFGVVTVMVGDLSRLFKWPLRKFVADYGLPLTVVFFTGFAHFPGRLKDANLSTLNTGIAFEPTSTSGGRTHGWFIHFWDINVGDVFLAIPFALLLTLLFYFDHNVSSLICQGTEFPLKKPSSFHWDFFLLGITTGVAGILGIPAPNGLIPQAPLHTKSLCVVKYKRDSDLETPKPYIDSVVEQRLSNTGQGLMVLGTMTGPLLICLGLIPKGVLAGLFWMMGISGLLANAVVARIIYILTEDSHKNPKDPLNEVTKWSLYLFTALETVGMGAEVAITQTIAAVGFPAVLMFFVLVGYYLPKIFSEPDLSILDAPAASEFILQSLRFDQAQTVSSPGSNSEEEFKSSLERGDGGHLRNRKPVSLPMSSSSSPKMAHDQST